MKIRTKIKKFKLLEILLPKARNDYFSKLFPRKYTSVNKMVSIYTYYVHSTI